MPENKIENTVDIKVDSTIIQGELTIPGKSLGVVLFAHGSGSSRFSPRNIYVARILQQNNLATFLVDLLTKEEDLKYENRFNIDLLAKRLVYITKWLKKNEQTKELKIGYFGASTGAAAAVIAASEEKNNVSAVVSRGGRVDLAALQLPEIESPLLLIVGGKDDFVLEANEEALKKINCTKKISVIPGATHLFEEPGTLNEVARHTTEWFLKFFNI